MNKEEFWPRQIRLQHEGVIRMIAQGNEFWVYEYTKQLVRLVLKYGNQNGENKRNGIFADDDQQGESRPATSQTSLVTETITEKNDRIKPKPARRPRNRPTAQEKGLLFE